LTQDVAWRTLSSTSPFHHPPTRTGASRASHSVEEKDHESTRVDRPGFALGPGLADFPTTPGAFDTTFNGYEDRFVARMDPAGANLVYGTFLGESYHDYQSAIALDAAGTAFIAGETESANFPTTVGAFDTGHNGGKDGFVVKMVLPGGPPPMPYRLYVAAMLRAH
jgi:hypothetical protein